jgi:hypothetical protein
MSSTDQPKHLPDGGVLEGTRPACVALVPLAQQTRWSYPEVRRAQPAPAFVTQLIATAEHIPQPLSERRSAAAEALSSYRSRQGPKVPGAGSWTQQIV